MADFLFKILWPLLVVPLAIIAIIARIHWLIRGYRLGVELISNEIEFETIGDQKRLLCVKFNVLVSNNRGRPVFVNLGPAMGQCIGRLSSSESPIMYPLVWSDTQSSRVIGVLSSKAFELQLFEEGKDLEGMAVLEPCSLDDRTPNTPRFFRKAARFTSMYPFKQVIRQMNWELTMQEAGLNLLRLYGTEFFLPKLWR